MLLCVDWSLVTDVSKEDQGVKEVKLFFFGYLTMTMEKVQSFERPVIICQFDAT